MTRIVSSIPGRIRVRDKGLRDPEKLNTLKTALYKITAITELRDNARTGSILILFDRNIIELSTMEANIDSAADRTIGKTPKRQSLLSKKNINRYNKIFMLASLGTSLVALKMARRKSRIRWHKLTGYLFIANLGVHLYIYRKGLLRVFR